MGFLDCFGCCRRGGGAGEREVDEAATAQIARAVECAKSGVDLQTGAKIGPISRFYDLGKVIGSGSYSVVREGVHKRTKTKFAIKCMRRADLSAQDEEGIRTEVEILKSMRHPHIMRLEEFYVDAEYYYLVTEFIGGGELFDRIVEKTFYSEKEARDLVRVLLETIKHCHDHNVVHRDLKPENLLLMSGQDDSSIKLADFGFAKKVVVDTAGLETTCGTPGYVAPEILERQSYGKPVDIWSIGVITYILLAGYPPFHDDSQAMLFRKIRRGKFQFDPPYWDAISDDAKDFIRRMLVVRPSERATAGELLEHRWITGTDVANVPLTSTLTELRRFHARKKFKAAVLSVQTTIALNRAFGGSSTLQTAKTLESEAREGVSM